MRWSVLLLTWTWACCPPPSLQGPPPPPPPFDTSTVLEDQGSGYCFGAAVAPAGDVNGDGYGDLVVGGSIRGSCGGDAVVILGGPEGLDEGSATVLETGSWAASYFGSVADGAGDLNGDGYDDLIVGSGGPGAYVYRGGADGPESEPWLALEKPSWHEFGRAVAGAGDMNADGWLDVAVCGGDHDGAAVVYPGGPDGPSEVWEVTASTDCELGLAAVGDVNADGFDDLITGYYERDYLLLGDAALSIDRERLTPSVEPHSYEEPVYARGGDVNGDGWLDLASGRRGNGVSVYLGSAEGFTGDWDIAPTTLDLSGWVGSAVDLGGDMDGDGTDELVMGSTHELDDVSSVLLYAGHADGPGAGTIVEIGLEDVQGFGLSVAFAGDVNGDGFDDLAIGSPGEERVYILHGGGDEDGDGHRFPSDCLDSDPEVNPDGYETCNGLDDNCDGVTDGADAEGATAWYRDRDGDGFADHSDREDACEAPNGYIAGGEPWDCDDRDESIFPGADEVAGDAIDQDCDGWDDGEPRDAGEPSKDDEQEPRGCHHAPGAPTGLGLLLLVAIGLARRRSAWPVLGLLLVGCGEPSTPGPDDTGLADLAGVKLTTLMVGADGTTWLGGKQGRVARYSPGWGLHEEPAAGPGHNDSKITRLLPFGGELWATHDDTASRYDPKGWLATGLDVGETWEGYAGELLGVAQAAESLWALSEQPPDNDPDCYWGCSTTYDLYLHRWDGRIWVRVHHLQLDGSSGHANATGDELLLTHGGTVWRWDDGGLADISHGLAADIAQISGTEDGSIIARDKNGAVAVGDHAGLEVLEQPDGEAVDHIAATSSDDLYALAGGRLFHHDGSAWSEILIDTGGGTDIALGPEGTIHVLADDGDNSLHIGDLAGVAEVWYEGES